MDTRDMPVDLGQLLRQAAIPLTVAVIVVCGGYLLSKGFYTVRENENAVVLRFGKYYATTQPGMHLCIPFVDEILKVNVTEERRLRLPFGSNPERGDDESEEATLMLTGDLNAASVEWTIQWKVSDPKQKLLSFWDPADAEGDAYLEQVVFMAARTVMNRLVGDYSIDEVLTEKRPEIRVAAREATQAVLDRYQCGVTITDLQMQRVRPPSKVRPSFDAVNSAIQQRDQLENEANKERNKLIPTARAESDKKIREAEGYAARRRAEVDGEIAALRAKYEAYSKAPDVTRRRLYLEAMETVLSNIDGKTIIDADLNQVLPLLQLEQGDTP
jgi:membrane protease subunit HflK